MPRASTIKEDLAALTKQRAAQASGLTDASLEQIKTDPAMFRIAMAQGKAAFGDNCAACHGVGGGGAKGYPNLNDDDWLWGGSLDAIQHHAAERHPRRRQQRHPHQPDAGLRPGRRAEARRDHRRRQPCPRPGRARRRRQGRQGAGREALPGELRRLPWRRRQGQPGARRAQPDRCDLALRHGHGLAHRDHHQQPQRRDAGLGPAPRPGRRSRR